MALVFGLPVLLDAQLITQLINRFVLSKQLNDRGLLPAAELVQLTAFTSAVIGSARAKPRGD